MSGGDAAATTAFQHRMNGDQVSVLENANLAGGAVDLDDPAAGCIGHAVEIAVQRDHAVASDTPLELQHRLERSGGQRLEMRQFLGEVFGDNPPRGGMGSRIGDLIQPGSELQVQILEVTEAATQEKVLAHIAVWPLHFALRLGAIGTAGFWLVAVVSGESAQRGVVDDVTAFGIVAVEHGAHAVVEDFRRYAAELGESVGMASQQRLHVLVQHEAAPHHPAVAEHEREQPDDPLGSRLVGKDRAEMSEIHLRLTAGRRLETDLKAGGRSWTHLAQEILQRRVSAGISQPADLATQPTAGQFRNCRDALAQVALEWRQFCRSRRPRSISRRLDAACDVFRDGAPVQAGPPGDRRDGHPLLVQLQYHDQLRQPDHPSPPPTHRRRGGLSPDAVPTGPTQPALGVPPTYRDVGFSVARSGENSPGDDTYGKTGPVVRYNGPVARSGVRR